MSRDAFIGELRHRMAGLPRETVERTVEYYSELIADSLEDGVSEEEAVARLGSIEKIVTNVVKDTPLTQIVQTRVQEKKAKGVSGWLILLLVLGVILAGVVAVVGGIVELARLRFPQGLVLLGGGLICLGLCVVAYLLVKLITLGTVKLCKLLWTGVKSLFVGKGGKKA